MNPDSKSLQDADFLFRRTQEALSDWVLAVPVLFAFGVLILLALFARQNRGNTFLLASLLVGAVTGAGILGILSLDSRSRLAALLAGAGVFLVLSVVALARQMRDWVPAGFMAAISFAYVAVGLLFKTAFSWWVILTPVLGVALVYVAFMYLRDARTVHASWAGFLGFCRCLVYGILAFVFLLPGCQTWDTTESHSKVIVVFDVSDSVTQTVDQRPEVGQDPATLPSRQDLVIELLTGQPHNGGQPKASFIKGLLEKSPIAAYRFGGQADDKNVIHLLDSKDYSEKKWKDWLKPDYKQIEVDPKLPVEDQIKERAKLKDLLDSLKLGTNVGGSLLQIAKQESSSFVQAIIVFSDGQSNQGSGEAVRELLARVNNPKRKIPVFTVGVGEYQQPASIKIQDLLAPEVASPEDKFPVRVPVDGPGLNDEEFQITLEAQRIKDKDGKPTAGENKFVLGPVKGKFQGLGDNPHDQGEFIIDVQALKKIKAAKDDAGLLEGTWEFVAKVPRHPNEAFAKAEHVSDPPTHVLIQKRRLRVLLFAGGPNRDYQFVRTLLYREVLDKRVDLAVYLQTGRGDDVNQDVESEWLLTQFPDKLGPGDPGKHNSLNEYDVIIAFDPDWTALDAKQLKNLKEWVGTHAGGIIFVAGPVHTFHLSRPAGLDLTSLATIYPVVLKDSRLHSAGIGHDASRPYHLNFTPAAKNFEFLKLDEKGLYPTSGWNTFFWKEEKPEPGKDAVPKRGFYNYYPVQTVKPGSTVVATFAGPPGSRINDGKDEQPYLVSMQYGSGKTFYMGSMEMWRLRPFKETYHERFWIKLARYVASSTVERKKYGRFTLGRFYTTGTVNFEAQLKGADLQPLPRDANPTVLVKRPANFDPKLDAVTPESFEMRPKNTQGEWQGWFTGAFKVRTPGDYEFKIPIPATADSISQRFTVRQPNPEMDNVRNNFKELYRLSSDAGPVLAGLSPDARRELERLLKPPADEDFKDQPEPGKTSAKLFFNLKDAPAILRCLKRVAPNKESTKGRLIDLWDSGFGRENIIDTDKSQVSAYYLLLIAPAVIFLLAAGILFLIRRPIAGAIVVGVAGLFALSVFLVHQIAAPPWAYVPLDMSFVLAVVVTLLSIEWLTRKLLKLA
jgi:hypothetical protein